MLRKIAEILSPSRFPPSPVPSSTEKMTAVVMERHGDAAVLHEAEFAKPCISPKSRQVLIRVVAAGLNPVDFKMRKGPIADFIYPKPKIIGSDISGVVVEVNEGSQFRVGQNVLAMLPLLGTQYGGYAHYCCVDEELVVSAPDGVDMVELGTVPLVACTVVQALRGVVTAYGGDTKGKKCFVQAGKMYNLLFCFIV